MPGTAFTAVRGQDIQAFRRLLKTTWALAGKITRAQAAQHVREVALAAQNLLQLNGSVVVMEFACGACHALDEYTLYLTPNQLRAFLVKATRNRFID